jgi:cyclic pyranopterin phosphate synthase
MPAAGVKCLPHAEVLSFEEITRVVEAAVRLGVRRVRLTGGEPLVRRGLSDLVAMLAGIKEVEDLALTTNGTLLAPHAPTLKAAGLTRVTVSMDTLRPERYLRLSGRPWLRKVMAGLAASQECGLMPVKINVVVVPGENDDEAVEFALLAERLDLEVRFIERMPLRAAATLTRCGIPSDDYIPAALLRQRIESALGPLTPLAAQDPRRPARVFALPSGRGRVGFIAPMSEPFCRWCSRMRVTPDGKLRVCLAQELELDLKKPLREGAARKELAALFEQAVLLKPEQEAACFPASIKTMSQIGG